MERWWNDADSGEGPSIRGTLCISATNFTTNPTLFLWNGNRVFAVRGLRLSAWAWTGPVSYLTFSDSRLTS